MQHREVIVAYRSEQCAGFELSVQYGGAATEMNALRHRHRADVELRHHQQDVIGRPAASLDDIRSAPMRISRWPCQQAIYQLGPEFIASMGIPPLPSGQVMLRGVCAFGIAGRGMLKLCCDMGPSRLKKMSLRYAGATYTGETLVVDVWKLLSGRAAFVVRSLERDVVVLKNGYVEYRD